MVLPLVFQEQTQRKEWFDKTIFKTNYKFENNAYIVHYLNILNT